MTAPTSRLADVTGGIATSGTASSGASFGDTDTSQRTSNVALGRSPRFNAAIFGNSHGQLLSPQRLSRATGLSFVQLTVPGSNVREQLAMMHWFIAHHADIGAMVLALDERWCVTDPALPLRTPFPFWLYSDSNLVYLANAMSTRSLRDSFRRVAAFGSPPSVDPAGYADYEMGKAWTFKPGRPATADEFPVGDERSSRDFPGLVRLDAVLGEIPAATPVVIVMPPQFYTRLPPAGHAGRAIPRRLQGAHRRARPPRRRQRVPGLLRRLRDRARAGKFHGRRALPLERRADHRGRHRRCARRPPGGVRP